MIKVFSGSNSFLIRAELKKIFTKFETEFGSLALEKIDGEEAVYDKIRESLESMPFLSAKKLVYLRAPSANKEFTEKSEELLSNLSETTDVVIYEPKLDKRTAYYKYLHKNTEFFEFGDLSPNELVQWIISKVQDAGGTITNHDANYLINRVGSNQQLLNSEVSKLLMASKVVTKNIINELTEPTPQSSIFNLLDAAFLGEYKKVLEIYSEQRKQNIDPTQIIALLSWQLHVVAICAFSRGQSSGEIAKKAKLNPYVVQKSLTLANKLTVSKIKNYINRLLEIDEDSKTKAINTDDALQAYLLAIS